MRLVKLFPLTMARLLAILLLGAGIGSVNVEPLLAATTFTVNASFDAIDANPGDGICAISAALGGACTLRAAIQEANLSAGADTINLPAGAYLLTIGGTDGNLNQTQQGDLDIIDSAGLTINGNGATIIGQYLQIGEGLFSVVTGAKATINGLTIQNSSGAYTNLGQLILTNGKVQNGLTETFSAAGSGVTNIGVLEVRNFTFTNLPRAAIDAFRPTANPAPHVTLINVKISNISSSGLVGSGDWEIVNSTVENSKRGIDLLSAKSLTLRGSTISNNTPSGGVIFNSPIASVVDIRNTTISGNTNNAGAGGLELSGGSKLQATLNNVTLAGNKSTTGDVGGLKVFGKVTLKNSILAGNSGAGPDCATTVGAGGEPLHSQGFNLIGGATGCAIDGDTASNITGVSPQLGALQNNGGPTKTQAPLSGSPVVNKGSAATPGSGGTACEAKDQIGTNRPQGGRCDIGAVEGSFGAVTTPAITSINPPNTTAPGSAFNLTVNGSNFDNSSVVRWQNSDRTTTFGSANQLTAAIPATDLVAGALVPVTVFNPVQGRTSNSLNFTINNPVPTVTDMTPTTVRRGTRQLRVSITGTHFVPTSEVLMDGQPLPTTFVNSAQVQAQVPDSALTQVGQQLTFRVRNPAPGGGTSANFKTLSVIASFPLNIGEGQFRADIKPVGLRSTLTLTWTHPTNWRLLNEMDVRLVDEKGEAALWLGFDGDFGSNGALLIRDANGVIAGLALPGDNVVLSNRLASLDVANSVIKGPPGKTVSITYAVTFSAAASGKTFNVELYASDDNDEGHGFESFGAITISEQSKVFLPLVIK